MTFNPDEIRIQEITQIEAAANCQISAGGPGGADRAAI
jgi:hypothetical protein